MSPASASTWMRAPFDLAILDTGTGAAVIRASDRSACTSASIFLLLIAIQILLLFESDPRHDERKFALVASLGSGDCIRIDSRERRFPRGQQVGDAHFQLVNDFTERVQRGVLAAVFNISEGSSGQTNHFPKRILGKIEGFPAFSDIRSQLLIEDRVIRFVHHPSSTLVP